MTARPSILQRMLAVAALALCLALASVWTPAFAKTADAFWVTATGHAFVSGKADAEAAKRRALVDALVSAALAGGAELRGYSAVAMGRISGDFTVMRPTGKVYRYELIEARLSDTHWTVGVRALVGPAAELGCAPKRTLVLTAETPRVSISPYAPAWAEAMAREAAQELYTTLEKHPNVALDRILASGTAGRVSTRPVAMDYRALTQGRVVSSAGDHLFMPEFMLDVRQKGTAQYIDFTTDLIFQSQTGETIRRRVERSARLPQGLTSDAILGRGRVATLAKLTDGYDAAIKGAIDAMACEPPKARLAMNGKTLFVPIGRRHGLGKTHLAFTEDTRDQFGLLEIVNLTSTEAHLRPLDPTRSAASFAGRTVHFIEAGL